MKYQEIEAMHKALPEPFYEGQRHRFPIVDLSRENVFSNSISNLEPYVEWEWNGSDWVLLNNDQVSTANVPAVAFLLKYVQTTTDRISAEREGSVTIKVIFNIPGLGTFTCGESYPFGEPEEEENALRLLRRLVANKISDKLMDKFSGTECDLL